MRINITNCRTDSPSDSSEFRLSFDADYITTEPLFEKKLAESLRNLANMLDAPAVKDKEVF